jgi:hypothetical protein
MIFSFIILPHFTPSFNSLFFKNCPAMGDLNRLKFRNGPNFCCPAGFFAGNKKCPKGH